MSRNREDTHQSNTQSHAVTHAHTNAPAQARALTSTCTIAAWEKGGPRRNTEAAVERSESEIKKKANGESQRRRKPPKRKQQRRNQKKTRGNTTSAECPEWCASKVSGREQGREGGEEHRESLLPRGGHITTCPSRRAREETAGRAAEAPRIGPAAPCARHQAGTHSSSVTSVPRSTESGSRERTHASVRRRTEAHVNTQTHTHTDTPTHQ